MDGSNDVKEVQSSGLLVNGFGFGRADDDAVGDVADVEGVPDENRLRGECPSPELGVNDEEPCSEEELAAVFGTENVNDDCFNDRFSCCRRESKSRRFSFSLSACSFFASRAATLSSS